MSYQSKLLRESLTEVADDPDYRWVDGEGVSWSSAAEYLGHVFGFCGCGMPEVALTYVRDALAGIKSVKDAGWTEEAWRARDAQFASDGERYFVWYRLDDLGLAEHGGGVPGWLTDKGEAMLDALNEALEEEARAPS